MRSDPRGIYELYKLREEIEVAFDAMKSELGTTDRICMQQTVSGGYFFISFISLYMYFSILQVLKDHGMS